MRGDDDMYIALRQTNHSITTLAENLAQREVVVDVPDATKRGATVDALHQVLAHLDALDPHVLKGRWETNGLRDLPGSSRR